MILEVRDLRVTIASRSIVSIEHLYVKAGERVGLVGESGSGKSMTALALTGLLPSEAKVAGSIVLNGQELVGRSDRELADIRRRDVGIIFQDPLRALNPTMRVGKQIAEGIRLGSRLSRSAVNTRVRALLDDVRLGSVPAIARRYPHQLSGGQRQRVMIAIALASDPKLLIADEATTALDLTVQQGVLELLTRLSAEREVSLLMISHDLGVIRAICERVAVMRSATIVEAGDVNEVLVHPTHSYTASLIAANLSLDEPAVAHDD